MGAVSRRLFIALPVDDGESIKSLAGVLDYFNKKSFLKVVPADNFHLTIKFFGEIESDLSDLIIKKFKSLHKLKKISYTIQGLGAFPSPENPAVIWAGLKCEKNPINEIIDSVEDIASQCGFSAETRKFVPHLTLARIKRDKCSDMEFQRYLKSGRGTVFTSSVFNELALFESVLKPSGAEYKKVAVIQLA